MQFFTLNTEVKNYILYRGKGLHFIYGKMLESLCITLFTRGETGSIPNWYGSAFHLHGNAWHRSAIRASLGLLAERSSLGSIPFRIDPFRVNSTDRSQTGMDGKRGNFNMLAW